MIGYWRFTAARKASATIVRWNPRSPVPGKSPLMPPRPISSIWRAPTPPVSSRTIRSAARDPARDRLGKMVQLGGRGTRRLRRARGRRARGRRRAHRRSERKRAARHRGAGGAHARRDRGARQLGHGQADRAGPDQRRAIARRLGRGRRSPAFPRDPRRVRRERPRGQGRHRQRRGETPYRPGARTRARVPRRPPGGVGAGALTPNSARASRAGARCSGARAGHKQT